MQYYQILPDITRYYQILLLNTHEATAIDHRLTIEHAWAFMNQENTVAFFAFSSCAMNQRSVTLGYSRVIG